MTILYAIILILALHYSLPGSIVFFSVAGICLEIAKAIGRGIESLMEDI